ncbi:MAG: flippase-like domain-containing protein [Acholeplasmatales bacterium]|nr:flippase-like domain-containing protein [Acholeplasmatales bacterium]
MYSKKKIIKYLILILAILILLVVLLTQIGDIQKIFAIFGSGFNPLWLLLCIGLIFAYCFVYKLSLIILVKRQYKHLKFWDLYLISGSEFFFNAVTPFSSGGQPFQAYALKQKNVSLSDSTSQLLLNFLAYQVSLNLISIICAIVYFNRLHSDIDNFIVLFIVGFSINLFIMVLLLLLGCSKLFGKALIGLINGICKIKPIKKLVGDKTASVTQYVEDMQKAFKDMRKDMKIWFLCLFTKIAANMIYYCVPFVGFYVIGHPITGQEFWYCFALTSFSLTTTIWVPLPGASGGVEFAFLVLFKNLITQGGASDPDAVAQSGMLIWRLLTYYFVLGYGLVDYIVFDRSISKDMKKNELTLSEKEIILETDESINNDSSKESNENKEVK